jgi:hypothetical protein
MAPELYAPTADNWGQDIETLNWTWNTVAMHDSCIVSARGMAFSSWDGAA